MDNGKWGGHRSPATWRVPGVVWANQGAISCKRLHRSGVKRNLSAAGGRTGIQQDLRMISSGMSLRLVAGRLASSIRFSRSSAAYFPTS